MTMFNLFISFSLFLLNSSVLLLLFIILFFNKRILSSFSFNKLFLPLIISSNSVNLLLLFNNSNSISFTNINSDIYLFPLLFFLLLSSLSLSSSLIRLFDAFLLTLLLTLFNAFCSFFILFKYSIRFFIFFSFSIISF